MGMESFNTPPQEHTPEPPPPPKEDLTRFFSTNPSEVLGVPAGASVEDIETARKNLQRKFHPDINHDPKAKEIAQNINNAFDVLNGKGEHAVLGGHSALKTKPVHRPENGSQSDYVNETLNNLWRENEARYKNWQKEQESRFSSHNMGGKPSMSSEEKKTSTNTKNNEKFSNEVITTSAEIEMGMFVPSDYFVEIMEYGRLRNVRVDFFIKKELPLSKIYKVDFKGKPKDIQTVADYIKNRPKVKL